jgi:phosphoribosylformylglycinamidine cyclo-ligase
MKKAITYKETGVDIEAGDAFVRRIKGLVESTFRPGVHGELGGFAGAVSIPESNAKGSVLVSSTDGVGTKLKIAFMMDRHDTVGIDLVAMCVNDIIVTGARPLFFLDYLAMGKLDPERAVQVVQGIAGGCREAGCSLLGGETAEMPDFYGPGEYDLAGFAVGIIEKKKIVDPSRVRRGDRIIGIASNGLHSNGFSLVRRVVFDRLRLKIDDWVDDLEGHMGEVLLKPTRIYVETMLDLLDRFSISAMAHITGGGIPGNLARVIPSGLKAVIEQKAWSIPPVFRFLQNGGGIPEEEMWRTFNNGIGMILVARSDVTQAILERLENSGERAFVIGEVVEGSKPQVEIV